MFARWKNSTGVIRGHRAQECSNCGTRSEHQNDICPACGAYMVCHDGRTSGRYPWSDEDLEKIFYKQQMFTTVGRSYV